MTRKTFLSGLFSLTLAIVLSLAGCNTGTDPQPENSNPTEDISKNITVFMQKPSGWSQVYAYIWDDDGTVYTAGTPGNLLTTADNNGYYSIQAKAAEFGYVNVKFSDGNTKSSIDILGVNQDTYYKGMDSYLPGSSELLLQSSNTSYIPTPTFKKSEVTDSTVTLEWDPVPGADGYVLYDEWVEFDDDEEEIPNSEYWHFQKAFVPSERSIFDDNYGEYLDPESIYTWKLVAIKYKDGMNLSMLDSQKHPGDPDYISEADYSPYYNVVYDFGELEVETAQSSLPAPSGLHVTTTTASSVELAWDPVANADYYMVWWYDEDADEWLYIEEAYEPHYLDDDEEFIFPSSTYKYLVVAHNEKTYSKDSNKVMAYTPSGPSYSVHIEGSVANARAVVQTPLNPSYVSASANPYAASQISVNWASVSGAGKYDVGLFTSQSGNPKTSKTVSGTTSFTFTSVPTSPGVFYVGVRAVNGSKKSGWQFTSYSVSPFPKVSIQSATSKTSGGYKTITIKMNASWKAGASYGYRVTVTDPYGYGVGTWVSKSVANTNTITISNVPKGPKYTVKIEPYTSGVYGNPLVKYNM